jgi:hypothetical protein
MACPSMTHDNATQSSARADRVSDQFSDYSPADRPMLRQLQDIGTTLWQLRDHAISLSGRLEGRAGLLGVKSETPSIFFCGA